MSTTLTSNMDLYDGWSREELCAEKRRQLVMLSHLAFEMREETERFSVFMRANKRAQEGCAVRIYAVEAALARGEKN